MKKIGSVIIVVLVVFFALVAYNYIDYRSKNAVSDAAFVKSDNLMFLSFKVPGKLIELTKTEGEEIKKGELLAKIDPKDFLVEKSKIENEIASLKAKKDALSIKNEKLSKSIKIKLALLNNKKAKLTPNIASLEFAIDGLKAKLLKLDKDISRFTTLFSQKLIQKEKLEALTTKQQELTNQISSQKSKLTALKLDYKDIEYNIALVNTEKYSIKELKKEILSLSKKIDSLKNTKESIENKISYTNIFSPIDGIVAKRFVSNNRVVDIGSLVYSVVDLKSLYLEVLLSEKKLSGVKVGNSVKITIDAIKNKEFKGEIESILPASASTFSLVPRDIASGEFTKLDQRFVVRVKILDKTDQLRVGMGATVAIKRD